MKRSLIVLLVLVLVFAAFFVGTEVEFNSSVVGSTENIPEIKDTTESMFFSDVYYEEETSVEENVFVNPLDKLGGVWEFYLDGRIQEVISINCYWEIYKITFYRDEYGGVEATYEVSDMSELTNKSFETDWASFTLLDDETLKSESPFGDFIYEKKSSYSTDTFSGKWRAYNNEKFDFTLVNLALGGLSEMYTYSDMTYRMFNYDGYEDSGEYSFVNDATAVKFEYNGREDIYEFELIGNGLLLLSDCGRERNRDGSTEYCLLELSN